ncbi:hypothetical protein M0R04_02080 [Candidatus Dojkabacteria bacterium]|jgi:hypothetical protein|nr:hypothetical protein [Candidatus Dojkabacteria bacterium]
MNKIKEFLKNIITYIKEKKIPVLWIVGAGLLAIFLVISLISSSIKAKGVTLIEQPLTFYTKFSVEIPSSTISSLTVPKKGLSIYKVKDENNNIKVEGILTALGIATTKKIITADIYYQWNTKNNDILTYDKSSQTIKVQLTDSKEIFPDITAIKEDKIGELLPRFVKEKMSSGAEYFDTKVSKDGSGYIIEGRKKINGYPISQGEIEKYYDNIKLDKNFNLKSFRISIPTFEDTKVGNIKLVLPANLAQAASNPSYPKQIFSGNIVDYPVDKKAVYDSYLDPSLKSSYITASSVEVVYYFVNTKQQFLTPMYRIEGNGGITSKGKEYTVPLVVITSALSPDRVYIPSNIKYAY